MNDEPDARRLGEPRILYVAAGDAGGTIREAVDRAAGVAVEATDGTDAIKRFDYGSVDLAVVPASLPDVPLDVFLRWADVEGTAGPPIVVGEVGRTSEPMIQVAGDVSVEALGERIDRAIVDRRLGDELDRHGRLKTALLRVAGPVVDAGEPGRVERVVYDELLSTHAYRSVWVGRVDPVEETIDLTQPVRHRSGDDWIDSIVGPDAAFVSRAVESGEVRTARVPSGDREVDGGGSDAGEGERGDAGDGDAVLTAVPFWDGERAHGVAILSTTAADAPDATERSLLGRIGRVCGLALADRTGVDDDAAERIEGLFRVVAHELRNPLQVASLSLELAREEGDDAAFERLSGALETMETVVDTTVDMAIGDDVGEVEETDVHEVAVNAWRDVREPPAELTIVEPATVEADPDQLERLLSNLLRNAIDHAGPDVSVRVGTLDDRGGFYVEDDGPGVPRDERESVFEWGYSTQGDGLGVGLPFVREIADAHGWSISVTGASGGARFEVRTGPGRPGPRDELTRLFSGDSEGFQFRDAKAE